MGLARLLVLGNLNLDLGVGDIPAWPTPGTESLGHWSIFRTGGSAGNTALAAASLGVPVELHAAVGDDPLGGWILRSLSEAGVDCTAVRRLPAPTAFSFSVTHPGGERTFFSSAGHLPFQGVGDEERILEAPSGSVVIACGYHLLPRWRAGALQRLFSGCRERGLVTVLDTGWPPGGQFDRQELQQVLQETDLFLPNADEAKLVTGAPTLEHALRGLDAWVPAAVVKDGPHGAWVVERGRLVHVPVEPSEPRETVGAGDAFNAAFLYARFFRGLDLEPAVAFGVEAARLALLSDPRRYPATDEVVRAMGRRA
ncbi:ribokinase [Limnochorda pilosa]|uniref:Ribokinase n=2 Tax=Limnochorda pilosa TaxID=1555112 RepID=A0A0K2SH89_LIMPI|nr:ribokinase [Limnochorda pilosa]